MNNLLTQTLVGPQESELIQAANLMAAAIKNGRVKIKPDGTFMVIGSNLDDSVHQLSKAPDIKSLNKFLFDGVNWTLQFDGKVVFESDRIGLHYIKQLVQRSHKEVHVSDLVTSANGEPVEIMDAKDLLESGVAVSDDDIDEISDNVSLEVITSEFKDEILPDEDRGFVFGLLEKEYKHLAMLEKKGLSDEVIIQKEKIKGDIQQIEAYLDAHRFFGKNVCFEDRGSRDRASVKNAISRTIEKLRKVHPSLAEHLRDAIRTGFSCSYVPKLDVDWIV